MDSLAYDMNPTLNGYQSLLINSSINQSDLNVLLDSCEEYMLTIPVAEKIIAEVTAAVGQWRQITTRLGVPKHEIERMSGCFKK